MLEIWYNGPIMHRGYAKNAMDNKERELHRQEAKDLLWDGLGLLAMIFFLFYIFPFMV